MNYHYLERTFFICLGRFMVVYALIFHNRFVVSGIIHTFAMVNLFVPNNHDGSNVFNKIQ